MFIRDAGDIQDRLTAWWEHEDQKRPCILINLLNNGAVIPDTDDLEKYWTDSDFVTDRAIALTDNTIHLGEAMPHHFLFLGSFMVGGFLGGDLKFMDKWVSWHKPFVHRVEDILNLEVKPDNRWWKTVRELTAKSAKLAYNHHYISVAALSGVNDIISNVYGLEPALIDYIDNPCGMKMAIDHVTSIWINLFNELNEIIRSSGNTGSITWSGVWAPGTTFPIQEDVSYMLSKEMFDTFCMPGIEALADSMDYPYYHLDGKGAVKFLDRLLGIRKLKAIQWVSGAGNEELSQWHDLIKHILDGGKSAHVYARADEVDALVKAVGSRGLLISVNCRNMEEANRVMDRYSHKL